MMEKALQFEKLPTDEKNKQLIELMRYVRDNHTYLNRIDDIFFYFNTTHSTSLVYKYF